MAEDIAFENDWISNIEGLVTLTSDQVILNTVMHYSSTFTYMPRNRRNFCGRTDGHTHVCMYIRTDGYMRPALLGRLYGRVDLKMPLQK